MHYKISEYVCWDDCEAIEEGYSAIEKDNELCNAISGITHYSKCKCCHFAPYRPKGSANDDRKI